MSPTARISAEGRAFHAGKERSPNLDRSWGRAKLEEDVDLNPEREQVAVTVRTMLVKYARQLPYKPLLPYKTECMMQHSLQRRRAGEIFVEAQ